MSRVTDGHVPPTDPNNPWNRAEAAGMQPMEKPQPRHDDAAVGLDGPLLDDLLKARMTEGIGVGRCRGIALAESRFPQIHDNGYASGYRAGVENGYARCDSQLRPVIELLRRELMAAKRLTRGKVMEAKLVELINETEYATGRQLRPAAG